MLTPNTLFGVNSVNKGFIGLDASDIQTYNEKPFSTHYFINCGYLKPDIYMDDSKERYKLLHCML